MAGSASHVVLWWRMPPIVTAPAAEPTPAETRRVLVEVGRAVARLHDGGLVHGDLTTSNMLVRESDGALVRAIAAVAGSQPRRALPLG